MSSSVKICDFISKNWWKSAFSLVEYLQEVQFVSCPTKTRTLSPTLCGPCAQPCSRNAAACLHPQLGCCPPPGMSPRPQVTVEETLTVVISFLAGGGWASTCPSLPPGPVLVLSLLRKGALWGRICFSSRAMRQHEWAGLGRSWDFRKISQMDTSEVGVSFCG